MKVEITHPIPGLVPSLTATLDDPIGNAPRIVRIVGDRQRGPGRGRGARKCGACGDLGHQRNSLECPERGDP